MKMKHTMDTRIGKLQYEVGFPTAETAQKIYDEMDFQRAVLAYQSTEPGAKPWR